MTVPDPTSGKSGWQEAPAEAAESGRYREFPVAGPLSRDLVCLWTLEVREDARSPYVGHVLPDACIDLVFFDDGAGVVAGPATTGMTPIYQPGAVLVGARFRPGAARGWLRENAQGLLNLHVPLEDVIGPAGRHWAQVVTAPGSAEGRLQALQRLLLGHTDAVPPPDPVVAAAVRSIAGGLPDRSRNWSEHLGLSERQLRRRFHATVGYGPKTLERVLRLQHLLSIAGAEAIPPLASLAVWAGYADQPHMSREIRTLTDLTPTEVLGRDRGTLSLSELFKTPGSVVD